MPEETNQEVSPVETSYSNEYERREAYTAMEDGSDDEYTNEYTESSSKRRRRETRSCR